MLKSGLAVDIDDVLTPTTDAIMKESRGREEAVVRLLSDTRFLLELPLDEEAARVLNVTQEVTVQCYITSRMHHLHQVTQAWLTRHHLPAAPLITRDPSWQQANWKINHLLTHDIPVRGLVDDNWQAFYRTSHFTGYKFWFNAARVLPPDDFDDVDEVTSWQEIADRLQ